jgi:formylglycine-generating enzyme required for sulfatase activity
MMGTESGDRTERPTRRVTIAKPFGLGRYEVTVGQWQACITGGGCAKMPSMRGGTDETPIHNLTFSDANAYVTWLSRKTGQPYRLPSEAEWEYAARAGTTTAYWWGDNVDGKRVICRKCGSQGFVASTPPSVNSQPANPWGLVGMSGGVREWLADCWIRNYDKAPMDARPRLVRSCQQRITRGGSWLDEPADLRSATRGFYDAEVPYLVNGFRVARDLE